jgi:hypothetical protein
VVKVEVFLPIEIEIVDLTIRSVSERSLLKNDLEEGTKILFDIFQFKRTISIKDQEYETTNSSLLSHIPLNDVFDF